MLEAAQNMQTMNERTANKAILFIAQGAYSGRFPVAPGTAGTMVGVLLYLAMKDLPPYGYSLLAAFIVCAGIWAAGRAETILGRTDHSSIVIDEIAGYLVAMMLIPGTWQYLAAAFVLFRIFDILKPFPLNRLQEMHGGTGVMLDDIGAGIYTNIVLQTAGYILSR